MSRPLSIPSGSQQVFEVDLSRSKSPELSILISPMLVLICSKYDHKMLVLYKICSQLSKMKEMQDES